MCLSRQQPIYRLAKLPNLALDPSSSELSRTITEVSLLVDEDQSVFRPRGLIPSRPSLERSPPLDRQPDPGLTGAHGLIATIPGPNAENRGVVCSQSRRSFPSVDGQAEDARHEEQRGQLAARKIPPGGIFYRR
jgi:hypothetical protein